LRLRRSRPRAQRWPRSTRLLVGVTVLLVALVIPLSGCGGESKQAQAEKTVCSARSDIKTRIATLKTLTPSIATAPQIKEEVSAIVDDVKKIQGAQGDLAPARKQQVQHATQTFERDVESVVSNLASSFSLSGAGAQLETALRQLGTGYAQALEPIACS
jgi:Tfp pilus assembly protein PilP